jgi:hypothetical protein
VRVEVFIPDLPDPVYVLLLEELGDELSYAFGGCTVAPAFGKYRSSSGVILPDKVNILFADAPFRWEEDRRVIERYVREIQDAIEQALKKEESVLITVYPVFHFE